jgi:hypothetical protein
VTETSPEPAAGAAPEFDVPSLAEIATEVVNLRLDVTDLTAAVEALTVEEEKERGPSRWAWRYADASTADKLWHELVEFVDWLVTRYELTSEAVTVPPCWYRHPVAVEELTALMAAWQAAYFGRPKAARDDLIAWHDRWMWPCMARLQERAGWKGCLGARTHESRTLRPWNLDPDMESAIREDVSSRPAGAGSRKS